MSFDGQVTERSPRGVRYRANISSEPGSQAEVCRVFDPATAGAAMAVKSGGSWLCTSDPAVRNRSFAHLSPTHTKPTRGVQNSSPYLMPYCDSSEFGKYSSGLPKLGVPVAPPRHAVTRDQVTAGIHLSAKHFIHMPSRAGSDFQHRQRSSAVLRPSRQQACIAHSICKLLIIGFRHHVCVWPSFWGLPLRRA